MLRWLLRFSCFGLGFALGFLLPLVIYLQRYMVERFALDAPPIPSRVYAAPLRLVPGMQLSEARLRAELSAARYLEQGAAPQSGTFSKAQSGFIVHSRPFAHPDGKQSARRLRLSIAGSKLAGLADADSGARLDSVLLDPARIATFYGSDESERQPMSLSEMPVLLVAGVQAVEDRKFAQHSGVDPLGFARAMLGNLLQGRLSQGGSTITQQLVKNEILSRERSIERKLKEMILAILLERAYDKGTILEAYLNRAVLGQLGNQPIEGFPAAAEFFYGRPLSDLGASELAMLVGLLKASDRFNPRRDATLATQRRNLVLRQFRETGLIDQASLERAQAEPLNVIPRPSASRDRYPAFLDLVKSELPNSYPQDVLTSQGLNIHTSLQIYTQALAETALAQQLDAIDRSKLVQGAVLITGAETGAVLAAVGARDARASGFNRAVTARRPVGSLLKPFVYLLALSNPEQYSLASMLEDTPFALRLPSGQTWRPENYDHKSRGSVALIDALSNSLNQASARLGVALGVKRLGLLLGNLGVPMPADPPPAIILGAVELSPKDIAQAYQALASGGRMLPLRTVVAVLDREGKVLSRAPDPQSAVVSNGAIQLVNFALNATTRSGTARALSGQIKIDVAGKTGTSNDTRDSWYAGYTGEHLGVVWLGRDDNQSTGLTGASGALKVWSAIFAGLPSQPLHFATVDGMSFKPFNTGGGCEQWRFLPVLPPYQSKNSVSCLGELLSSP